MKAVTHYNAEIMLHAGKKNRAEEYLIIAILDHQSIKINHGSIKIG